MPKYESTTSVTSCDSAAGATTDHSEQPLGPNLQSRLEALEAAMGVRLNVAKRQGRHSLFNTASSSPMQISPTSTSSTTISTTTTTSLSTSTRHNIPTRFTQGVQRSASSCDVENRPGPIKRLKPSLLVEASSSTATAIATIKKYTPSARRPIPLTTTTTRPIQSKQSNLIKQRSSPMDMSSMRSSRSSIANNNSLNYRTTPRTSSKASYITSAKQMIVNSSPPSPPPPPSRQETLPRKQRVSIFGEQFSTEILKTNLLWIDIDELDDEGRTEVLIQFGSMENFLREQQLFSTKQQQQLKMAAKNKTLINRSRLHLLKPKKDRLELL